jgi:hypothetical protein
MTLYWYSRPYLALREWTYFNTAKIIQGNDKKIKLNIGKSTHQIQLENGFTEIMSENLPIKLVPEATEFELTDDIELIGDHYTIKSQKYDIAIIDDFLKTPDCMFYNFEDSDDWTVIKWSQNSPDSIVFETLRSFMSENVILKTKSEYSLDYAKNT